MPKVIKENKYVAIGHHKENKDIAMKVLKGNSLKSVTKNFHEEQFVTYIVMTSNRALELFRITDDEFLFDEVTKIITNHNAADAVFDFIKQNMTLLKETI